MKKDLIINALSGIDENIIDEVAILWSQDAPSRKAKLLSPRLMKFVGAAACVCLAFTLGFSIIVGMLSGGKKDSSYFEDIKGESPNDSNISSGKPDSSINNDIPADEDNKNDSNSTIPFYSYTLGAGEATLDYYDSYHSASENADVVTVHVYGIGTISALHFRENPGNEDPGTNTILRVQTKDGKNTATLKNGVFTLENTNKLSELFINVYFAAGTFEANSTQTSFGADPGYDDNASSPDSEGDDMPSVDNDEYIDTVNTTTIQFDCSVITPDGPYVNVIFKHIFDKIGDTPRLLVSGTADTLEEAMSAVDMHYLFGFGKTDPDSISYLKTNDTTYIEYAYNSKGVSIKAFLADPYETVDTVYSTEVNKEGLYVPLTTTSIHDDSIDAHLYECYKNDADMKLAYAIIHPEGLEGGVLFYVIHFDLRGEGELKYMLIDLLEDMFYIKNK